MRHWPRGSCRQTLLGQLVTLVFGYATAATVQYPFGTIGTGAVVATATTSGDITASDLTDHASGTGALSQSNLLASNRAYDASLAADTIWLSCHRESDAQTPVAAGGNSETTWMSFSVCPHSGGALDFSSATLALTTHALSTLYGTTGGDWTLYTACSALSAPYFSASGDTTSLGTQAGASVSGAGQTTSALTWSLASHGVQWACSTFVLDVVTTGAANGVTAQRAIGMSDFVLSVAFVAPVRVEVEGEGEG